MAKLYAELTSDKGSKVVGKGGDNQIIITLRKGNTITHTIGYTGSDIFVTGPNGKI